MRWWKMAAVMAVGFSLALPAAVHAQGGWLTTFNNLYGTKATRLNTCRVCHTAAIPARNPYGAAFRVRLNAGATPRQALIRIQFNGVQGHEAARYPMGQRIREVEQGPDGAIWLLEDGSNARLLKLTPNYG